MNNKRFYPTALALYFTYFIHGIGVSILAQYKPELSGKWGVGIGDIVGVSAMLGLGRLISLPIAGPMSDKFGRRINGIIGLLFYVAYFIGIITAPSIQIATLWAVAGGIANSFLDTCVTPSCLEIFKENGSVANMFTKFSISIGQLVLPLAVGFIAGTQMSYTTIFYVAAVMIIIDGILIMFLPFPELNADAVTDGQPAKKEKMKFTPASIAAITIGFTSTMTFMLWLNCNQEVGRLYGVENVSSIQMYYAMGTMLAIIVTAKLVSSFVKPIQILMIYPSISIVTLLLIYMIQSPVMVVIGSFIIGYAAAGGVLQLAVATANSMYPKNKGTITSIVMMTSSVGNIFILKLAGYLTNLGDMGPKYVLLLNVVITALGVALAIYLNAAMKKNEVNVATAN